LELARAGVIPGATDRNRESLTARLELEEGLDPMALELCHDPQTSGGLLIAIPAERASALLAALPEASVIGRVLGSGKGTIHIKKSEPIIIQPLMQQSHSNDCCATPPCESGGDIERQYAAFLRAANTPNALDAPTKQAIALALAIFTKCEPCVEAHLEKSRQMGFSEAEIDDAAWSAIAFGGAPIRMFYKTMREKYK